MLGALGLTVPDLQTPVLTLSATTALGGLLLYEGFDLARPIGLLLLAQPGGAQMSRRRVLVVEDDPGVRQFCVDTLEGLGYAVVAVDDGSLALQEIPRFQPDLILLDLIMSRARLNGVALLSMLA